jgi:uracil-DNA glycosylase family 4
LLDGLGTSKDYLLRAKELGQKFLAVTNHGNVDGLIKLQNESAGTGVTPIFGAELYIVEDFSVKEKGEKRKHITVLVNSKQGWTNLNKMLTVASMEGFYFRPRISPKLLLQHCEGMVILTACSSTFITEEWGRRLFVALKRKIGRNLFLEIMPHNYSEQVLVNRLAMQFSKEFSVPLVATNDCHYVHKGDEKTHEVLLAIQSKKKWKDPTRWKFSIDGLYLKSREEMADAFLKQKCVPMAEAEKALNNTMVVAELCRNFSIERSAISLPEVDCGFEDRTDEEIIRELCERGMDSKVLSTRYGSRKERQYRERLLEELHVIVKQEFARYFLLVWELVDWCKKNDIMVGPGRGSAGGSLVCFLLGITSVDPIKHDLLFARFISPARIDLPDIDMDFEDIKRGRIFEHFKEIYGENNVAAVSTFSSMKGKSAVRDVSRVFDVPLVDVNAASSCIVVRSGGDFRSDFTITDAFETFEDGRKFKKKYPVVAETAIKLEGLARSKGQHAAAICISKEDLRNGERGSLKIGNKGELIINWDKYDIEHVGLMKMDILGLRALTVLNGTKKLIAKNYGVEIDYDNLSLGDKKVYQEFTEGNNVGIFQFGSLGLRKICREIRIDNFKILTHTNALFRPGTLRCVAGDSLVKCFSGRKVRIDEIDIGRSIISSARPILNKRKYIKNFVKAVQETGVKPVYRVVDSDGNSLEATANHRFFVMKHRLSRSRHNTGDLVYDSPVWCDLSEMCIGDKVLVCQKHSTDKQRAHTKRFASSGKTTRYLKGSVPFNKSVSKRVWAGDYTYLHSNQRSHIKEASLANWKNKMFSDKEKWASSVDKMKATKAKFWKIKKNHTDMSRTMKEYYKTHEHPNETCMSCVSKPQREIYDEVKKYYCKAVLEKKVVVGGQIFFLDIAIPGENINIEFDGDYWHSCPGERVEPRDSLLEAEGWSVIRLTYKTYKEYISNLSLTLINNSTKFSVVQKIEYAGRKKTYDLCTENQEFPNYVVNNFVTHNSGMVTEYIARKKGEKKWTHKHEFMEKITGDTLGIILYQEQVMKFMYDLGGLGWKTADTVRKVMSKSQGVEQFMKFKAMFAEGCVEKKTLDKDTAEKLWDELASFGSYGFNKSHAVEYTLLAYWQMYCKVYYPAEFICASLTYGSDEKKEELIEEAIRLKIEVRPPKIGISKASEWIIKDGILYCPFLEIKGIGDKTAEKILEMFSKRSKDGFFKDKKISEKFNRILTEVAAWEDRSVTSEESEYISKYFDFSFNRDPYKKYRRVVERISESVNIEKVKGIDFSTIDKSNRFYFGLMTQIKFGYRGKIDTLEKKLDISGSADNLGGVYGNFKDDSDFCMLVFSSDIYNRKKDLVEHSSGEFLIAKANRPSRVTSIQCRDAWFGEEIYSCQLDGMDLSLIKNKRFKNYRDNFLEECNSCELREQCKSPVPPSRGLKNIMIVGEAPGKQEDEEGAGFVGASGKYIKSALKNFRLDKDLFHITTVVKCFPSKSKTPNKKQIKACSRWLDEEINVVSPVLIFAFGNTCMEYFKGEEKGIMDMCGKTEWSNKHNAWICYCINPASVLYHRENEKLFKLGVDNFVRCAKILGLK